MDGKGDADTVTSETSLGSVPPKPLALIGNSQTGIATSNPGALDSNGGPSGQGGIVILQQPKPGFVRSFKQTSLPPIRMKPTGIMPKKNVLKERPVIVKKRLPSPGAPLQGTQLQSPKVLSPDDEAAAVAQAKANASEAAAAAAAAAAARAKTSNPESPSQPPKLSPQNQDSGGTPAASQGQKGPVKRPLESPAYTAIQAAPKLQATVSKQGQAQTGTPQQPPLKKLAVLAAAPQGTTLKAESLQQLNIQTQGQVPVLRQDSKSEPQQLRPLKVFVANPQALGGGDGKGQIQAAHLDSAGKVQLGKVLHSLPKTRLVPASISPKIVVGASPSQTGTNNASHSAKVSGIQTVQQSIPTVQPNTTQIPQQVTVSSAKLQGGQFQIVAANGQKYVLTSSLFPTFTTTSQGNIASVQTSGSSSQGGAISAINQPITLQLASGGQPMQGNSQVQAGKPTFQHVSGTVVKGKQVPVQQALAKIATAGQVAGGQRIHILPPVSRKLIPGLTLSGAAAQTPISPGLKAPQTKITTLGQVGALTNSQPNGKVQQKQGPASGAVLAATASTSPAVTSSYNLVYQPPIQSSKNAIMMTKSALASAQQGKVSTGALQHLIPHHIIAGGNNQILLQQVLPDGTPVTPNSASVAQQQLRTKLVQAPIQIANPLPGPRASAPPNKPADKQSMPPPPLPSTQSGAPTLVSQGQTGSNLQAATLMQPQLLQTCGAQATIGLIQVPMMNIGHSIQLPSSAGSPTLTPVTQSGAILAKSGSTTPHLVASNAIPPGQIFQLVHTPGKVPILSPTLKDIEPKLVSAPVPIAPAVKPIRPSVKSAEKEVDSKIKQEPAEPLSSIDVALRYGTFPQAPIPMGTKRKASEMLDGTELEDIHKALKVEVVDKCEAENQEFSWEEYLDITGATAAPTSCFTHVESSLQCYVKAGMKVEVPNPVTTYPIHVKSFWVATVVTVSGSLLLLRYDGSDSDDRSDDFWWDLVSMEVHPIGWCARNGYVLQPPNSLIHKPVNWQEFLIQTLTGTKTIPEQILNEAPTSLYPVMKLKKYSQVDVIDDKCPLQAWICTIIENCGGRLKLRYLGYIHDDQDFWLFYHSWRVHPLGWAKDRKVAIGPPKCVKDQNPRCVAANYQAMYKNALARAGNEVSLPVELFKEHNKITIHKFLAGMRVEAVNPKAPSQICPATITKVFNIYFFRVTIDDLRPEGEREDIRLTCHGTSAGIFHIGWALQNGVSVTTPKGYQHEGNHFDWNVYLRHVKGKPANRTLFKLTAEHDFQHGMKLEATNPFNANQICPATVTKIAGRHMWLHFDGSKLPNHIVGVESTEIFPVGWCESNGYQLRMPKKLLARKTKRVSLPEKQQFAPMSPGRDLYHRVREVREALRDSQEEGAEEDWINKVYYNHKCFSGPYLNKGRIAELPKSVGPGMVPLVLREVLHMLINAAYKPPRVLRELQVENEETAGMNGSLHVMKAKYKGKSYRAMIELCKIASEVPAFLRSTCLSLECCPNLVSLNQVEDTCPEQCYNLNKSKYIQAYGRKHKTGRIGRPPTPKPTTKPNEKKGNGRRRKKRRQLFIHRKKHNNLKSDSPEKARAEGEGSAADASGDAGGAEGDPRRREVHHSAKKPLVSRAAKALLDSAKRTKLQYSNAPKLVLPHRERGTKMKTYAARLTSSRAQRREEEREMQEQEEKRLLQQHQKKLQQQQKQQQKQQQQQQQDHHHKHKHAKDKKATPTGSGQGPAKPENALRLDSNPLLWSVDKVVRFIRKTDCAPLAKIFKEQEIDGQALLLLTLPTVQECMELKLGPAIKLCHHIERVKIAFYEQFAS